MDIHVLIAFYSDGSATPQLLRAYANDFDAQYDMDMIREASPAKEIAKTVVWIDDEAVIKRLKDEGQI